MKLLNTGIYLLLIDEEVKGKNGINYNSARCKIDVLAYDYPEHSSEWNYCVKIIAYYPLKEAKELDLPLLPNPFKEEDEKWLRIAIQEEEKEIQSNREYHSTSWYNGVELGYKAAQQSDKQYSLDDMKKAIEMARKYRTVFTSNDYKFDEDEIIQSLSNQQLPVSFEVEYEVVHLLSNPPIREKKLKTIRNSENKEVLVGVYKY